ncbi:MucR family transcriptional regulator [Agrobacterium sp. 22-221-1]
MISIDVNSLNDLAEVEKAIEKLSFVRDALKTAAAARTADLIEQLKRDIATGAGLTYAEAYSDWLTISGCELVELNERDRGKVAPFMDPQEAIQDDGIVCLIDGKKRKFLARYVRQVHGLEWNEYRDLFDLPHDYPQTSGDLIAQRRSAAIDRGFGKRDRTQQPEDQVRVTVPSRRSFWSRKAPQVNVNIDINGSRVSAVTDRESAKSLRSFL